MLRRVIFVVVVCACVGVAYAGAVKIRWFENVAEPNPAADGMAILNYASGGDKTIVQIIVSDMTPQETYNVWLTDCEFAPEEALDVFTTDEEGHGTFHHEVLGADVSDCDVELFAGDAVLWSQPPDQGVLQPTAMVRTDVPPPAFTQLIADDFTLGTGETVTKVRWWGGTCGTPEITEFRIQFFDSVDGLFRSPLQTVTTGSLTPGATGKTLDCGSPEAAFEVDITPSFAPLPGSYFISIAGVDDDDQAPNFVWTGASPTGGAAFVGMSYDATEPTNPTQLDFEVAFELNPGGTQLRAVGCNPDGPTTNPNCP